MIQDFLKEFKIFANNKIEGKIFRNNPRLTLARTLLLAPRFSTRLQQLRPTIGGQWQQ